MYSVITSYDIKSPIKSHKTKKKLLLGNHTLYLHKQNIFTRKNLPKSEEWDNIRENINHGKIRKKFRKIHKTQ